MIVPWELHWMTSLLVSPIQGYQFACDLGSLNPDKPPQISLHALQLPPFLSNKYCCVEGKNLTQC